ncbi:hypothetical protein TNCV_599311 [Trichonephila clavipes]|nr:hypothetical protein TNCV_599311 [Trichonephila clavipes]
MARLGKELCSVCNDDRPHLSGCHSETTCTFVLGAMVLNFCLWMTTSVLTGCKHCRRMPSIEGYPPYGLSSIPPGLNPARECVICLADERSSFNTLPHIYLNFEGIA